MTTQRLLLTGCLLVLGVLLLNGGCGGPAENQVSRLTVLVTGHIQGYIMNCGCSSGQYGGLMRMARLMREELKKARRQTPDDRRLSPAALLVDIGNFTDPSTAVTRINSEGVVAGMMTLSYDVVGIGMYELSYQQEELWNLFKDTGLPLTAANLAFGAPGLGDDFSAELNELIKPYRLVDTGNGFITGVIHLIDDSVDEIIGKQNGFSVSDAGAAARMILEAHGAEAQYWIVTIADTTQHGTGPQALAGLPLVMQVIGFRQSNPLDSSSAPEKFPYFVDAPYLKAKDVVQTVTTFRPGKPPLIKVDRFAIPDIINGDPEIVSIIAEIAPRLERLENEIAEAALNEQIHPFYLGYEACRNCHPKVVEHQLTMLHAKALEALRDKGQERSAACLPCHVVGHASLPSVKWSGGWNMIEDQPLMRGVHCESCHGPGEYHVAAKFALNLGEAVPADVAAVLMEDGRNEAGLQPTSEQTCLVCHDELNSPAFDYDIYWPKIEHSLEMDQTP